jgi:hypothetical protein
MPGRSQAWLFDLALDLRDADGDFGLLARAVDDRSVFLGDRSAKVW